MDLVRGRALVFPLEQAEDIRGLWISPVGVVEGKDKRRIVHDMTSVSYTHLTLPTIYSV